MNDEASSQAAELNSGHRDVDPSLGTGFRGFATTHQSPQAHQPTSYISALGRPEAVSIILDGEPFVGIRQVNPAI
jgi:hypothetical protein